VLRQLSGAQIQPPGFNWVASKKTTG